MKNQINNVINFIKEQKVSGCISGSCFLDYFPDQDVDIFLYTKSAFIKLYYTLKHNSMFTIIDKRQKWISEDMEDDIDNHFKKRGIVSIKFLYNTCVTVNLVWKYDCKDIYSVLSSFDMNIVAKGYDILTKQEIDLTENSTTAKIADWNKHNTKFYKPDLWSMNSILRQFKRIIKYYDRGYNVDLVVKKYIAIIDSIQEIENIFDSSKFENILEPAKMNSLLLKRMLEIWLETHTISEEELKQIDEILKQLK